MYIEFCGGGAVDSIMQELYIELCIVHRELCVAWQMYIEFCGGGAVDSIMEELEKPLTEPQIRCICHEMCEGLDFLHQHFVIHRDLKAGNVLLTTDGQVRLGQLMPSVVSCIKLRRVELLTKLHLRATGCNLPYEITLLLDFWLRLVCSNFEWDGSVV